MKRLLLVFVAMMVWSTSARAACPSNVSWPTHGFPRRDEEPRRLFPERVKALDDYMFTLHGTDEDRLGIRTDALLVIHQGAIFYDRYARGYDRTSPHLAWSVTKTITSMLVAMAVADGLMTIDDSVCKHLKFAPASACDITVKNLLEFASGFDWAEDYEGNGTRQDSSVIAMLYGEGKDDMASFVLRQDRADPPGTAFRYSTGDAVVLGAIADEVLRPVYGEEYPWTRLFDPIGITDMTIERDKTGRHVGGAYSYAPAEDWARIGYFMLEDGCWEGQRYIPEGWMAAATQTSEPFKNKRIGATYNEEQGRHLWINRELPGILPTRPWPDLPEDTYSAIGHWNQFIAVIPSKDVVIVRSGDDRDENALDTNKMLALALAITGEQ